MSVRRFATHTDERGRLLVAEDADVGFAVRRVFAITGVPAGAMRGDHVVPCAQAMVLVAGGATVWTAASADAPATEFALEQPGDAVDLPEGVWVRYRMSGPEATVMVFAAAPYVPRGATR